MRKVERTVDILTVDEVTDKVRLAVCSVPELQDLAVRGELQGFKRHTSGHVYFTVVGKSARLSCVIWKSQAASILSWPKDGDEVLVRGRMDVYGAYGSYQVYATTLLPLGAGAKARAKAMLQQKLEKEGLFDPRNKRTFPRFPQKVAVITSPTSAALQDVLRISSQRWPLSEIVVIPSLMQGLSAASEIVSAFARLNKLDDISAAMLVRGGGSRDDLDVFDEEEVVRSVRNCAVPVITGLGHQIDSTLCDMAADAEAPTPSGAAEFLFPDKAEIISLLAGVQNNIKSVVENRLAACEKLLSDFAGRMSYSILNGRCIPIEEQLKSAYRLLCENTKHKIELSQNRLATAATALQAASPLSVLAKGYSVCMDGKGQMIASAKKLKPGQEIAVQLVDGRAKTQIIEVSNRTFKECFNDS